MSVAQETKFTKQIANTKLDSAISCTLVYHGSNHFMYE